MRSAYLLQPPVIRQMARQPVVAFLLMVMIGLFASGVTLRAFAALNDTGITTCSDAVQNGLPCPVTGFPRQDAEYGRDAQARAGTLIKTGGGDAGFDFTALDANGQTTMPSSGANPHSCVRDNVTDLMWEVKTDDGGLRDKDHTYSWYDSHVTDSNSGTVSGGTCKTTGRCDTEKYVADINAAGLCGFHDWRMPTVKELMSIAHHGRTNSSIDLGYFPNTSSNWFWTGVPLANSSEYAWIVTFLLGEASDGGNRNDGRYHIRLVRGTQLDFLNSFAANDDGTVTQVNTELMWAKCSEGQMSSDCTGEATLMTWSEALSIANNSRLAGYSNWRLPNFKELQSLVDYTRTDPAIEVAYFPNTPSSYFWSGSSVPDINFYSHLARVVKFNDGYAIDHVRNYSNHVRLVRDISGSSPSNYALSVSVNGNGGKVSGTGIACPGDCGESYASGTPVMLGAETTGTTTFTNWSGDCSGNLTTCTVTMDAIKNVTANFQAAAPTYSLTVNNFGSGTVSSTGVAGINCGPDCSDNYTNNQTVVLTATPMAGKAFLKWYGACAGVRTNTCTVTMNANQTATAFFTR
ncbi:DUF1566 domain-containing protein [Rhodopseudomonas palustris]|nr:DUF1566 domain-containing protein [Rhodopseudomonas palustris]